MVRRTRSIVLTAGIILGALMMLDCHENLIETFPYPSPLGMKEVMPFTQGNHWIYRVISMNIDGADTTADTVTVIDTLQRDGRLYYRYTGLMPSFILSDIFYYATVDSAEFAIYMSQGNSGREVETSRPGIGFIPYHLLKLPLKRGSEWVCMDWDTLYTQIYGTTTITETDRTIQLPGTTLRHAIHLESSDLATMDIVPGIGIVRVSFGVVDSWTKYELMEWRVR